jgi:phosphate-selective porin O/P
MCLRLLVALVMSSGMAVRAVAQEKVAASQGPAVRWSGYIQARETYRDGVGLTASINRARLSAAGDAAKDVTWRVQGEFRTGSRGTGRASVSLQDAFVRYDPGALGVQAGQFKTPFTREFITSLADVETADRAVAVDSFAPKRDIGIMADYDFGGDAMVMLGVFNGEGQNVTANADSSLLVVARATGRPLPFLSLGANLADYAGDSTRYGVDVSLGHEGATVRAEYLTQRRDGLEVDDKGWYALAAYRVVAGLQLVFRQEDFRRSAISAESRQRASTAGANFDFSGGKIRLMANYVSRKIGEPGVRRGTLIAQAQVKF